MATSDAFRATDIRERLGGIPGPTDQGGNIVSPSLNVSNAQPAAPVPGGGAPVTDPNSLDRVITPENTLRNQRLGFQVDPNTGAGGASGYERVKARNTSGSIRSAFESQLPGLNLDFERNVEALAARTAALGRSGSGLFNRDTGYIGDDARAAREGLLGNLIFTSTQNDANRALQAAMSNQGAGVSIAGLNSQAAIASANRSMQADLARQGHLSYLQQREDQLAREAMQDRNIQLQLAALGFQYQPTGSIGQAANTALAAGSNYGANAGMINGQLGDAASGAIQAFQPSGGPTVAPPRPPGPSIPASSIPQVNIPPFEWRPQVDRPDFSRDDLGL